MNYKHEIPWMYQKHRFCLYKILILFIILYCFYNTSKTLLWYSNVTPSTNTVNEAVQSRLWELVKEQKGSGCEMPVLDPFDNTIMGYYHDVPDRVECSGLDWVECHMSKCNVIEKILADMEDIVCVYQDIIYVNDDYYYIEQPTKVHGNAVYLLNKSDQVKISCSGVYKNRYNFITSRWQGFKAGYRPIQQTATPSEDSLNILMVIFDSVSMNAFIRRLPKSYQFLTEELNAIFLKSYNIIGDGTASALTPMLTGHTELELPSTKAHYQHFLDPNLFVFNAMKNKGYRTAFYEECADYSTYKFSYNSSTSNNSPADHYLRPFYLELYAASRSTEKRRICFGSVPAHVFLLNLVEQMFNHDGRKFCLAFSAGLSHDDLSKITMADMDLVRFLKKFRDDGRLEDTALFVMGDHGSRFAALRDTYQGKLEERLPAVSLVLPSKLKRQRPHAQQNLEANSQTLTTPFDIHTTLLDIAGLKEQRNTFVVPGADMERGLSLLDKIPKSRSCPEAGIMPHWCACASWNNVDVVDPLYAKIAEALAQRINALTEDVRHLCAPRELLKIERVLRHSPNKAMLGYHHTQDRERYVGNYVADFHVKPRHEYYQAQIRMSPGDAMYEGSVQYVTDKKTFVLSDDDISRIDTYGDESNCIFNTHVHLRKYCYCYKSS